MNDSVRELLDNARIAAAQVAGEGRFFFLCRFGWHKWGHWNCVDKGEIRNTTTDVVIGDYEVQRRCCTKCGRAVLRTIKTEL